MSKSSMKKSSVKNGRNLISQFKPLLKSSRKSLNFQFVSTCDFIVFNLSQLLAEYSKNNSRQEIEGKHAQEHARYRSKLFSSKFEGKFQFSLCNPSHLKLTTLCFKRLRWTLLGRNCGMRKGMIELPKRGTRGVDSKIKVEGILLTCRQRVLTPTLRSNTQVRHFKIILLFWRKNQKKLAEKIES